KADQQEHDPVTGASARKLKNAPHGGRLARPRPRPRSGRWVILSVLLAVAAAACGDDRASTAATGDPCYFLDDGMGRDTGLVVVRDVEPPCVLEFEEVVTLEGGLFDGSLPRVPVVRG